MKNTTGNMTARAARMMRAGAIAWIAIAAALSTVDAAEPQRINVPLSEPSRPVTLYASLVTGGISVATHEAGEVIVIAHDRKGDEKPSRVNGMMRIPNRSMGLTVEEDGNVVRISSDHSQRDIQLEVLVPRNTSMRLGCVNDGDIEVKGVKGELELNNTNGSITALNIVGSVIANTTNGDVHVILDDMERGKAMSFISFNGDVDVTFPPDFAGKLRMSSVRGDVLTDFDVKLDPQKPVVDREESDGHYRVRVEEEARGTVGSGGPEFHFKTYNGDVFIRKGTK